MVSVLANQVSENRVLAKRVSANQVSANQDWTRSNLEYDGAVWNPHAMGDISNYLKMFDLAG